MGFYDRDYMRSDFRRRRGFNWPSTITMWLIVINVAVFVIDGLLFAFGVRIVIPPHLYPPLVYWGHFSQTLAIENFQVWRFITFQFLHGGVGHLLFNMIALFFFGRLVESYLGPRRFVPFYLISGIGGAALYLILRGVAPGFGPPHIPLVGASAGIFGILIAAAQIAPRATVFVFGVFPMQLRTLAWVFIAIAVFTIITAGPNVGGEAAHLGGAAVGFALIRMPWLLRIFERLGPRRSMRW